MESSDEEHPTLWDSVETIVGFAFLAVLASPFVVVMVIGIRKLLSSIF